MSIVDEITRLTSAKANIKAAIEAKGVSVPSSAHLDAFPSYVSAISGGGGGGNWWDAVLGGTWDGVISMNAASVPTGIAVYLFGMTPSSIPSFTVNLPITTWIDGWAFSRAGVYSVNAPLVEVVGSSAFASCSKLVHFSASRLRYVSSSAFYSCAKLLSISSPSMSYLGSGAFYYCYSLQTVRIGDNIDQISLNRYCFNGCSALESLYLLAKSSINGARSDYFANTPMVNSALLGHYGSIYVRASVYSKALSSVTFSAVKDRLVSLTDAQIAALP